MNASHRRFPIPKEIECSPRSTVDHRTSVIAPLHEVNEKTGKIESRRRNRRHGATCTTSQTKRPDRLTTEELCISSHSCFKQNRRRESLRSVSREACFEAQKFLETKRRDILLDYPEEEIGNSPSQTDRDENDLPLSELAGLLAEKLGDAIERGLFSLEFPVAPKRCTRSCRNDLDNNKVT
ncbi:hypothetical protein MHU86_3030 [Fragilaria crotonensis]|nr:hypothetical protein MHU86_3030 [Fragilaria crotonensis]